MVKFRLPYFAELFQPVIYLFHFFNFQRVIDLPALLRGMYKTTFAKDLQVFGYRLPGAVKVFRNSIGRHGLEGNEGDNSAPCGVCNRLEYVSSHKYKSNRSVANIRANDRLQKRLI